jgi:ribosome assembly protein RRB1
MQQVLVRVQVKPMQAHMHAAEGFAIDWSRQTVGALASGDCSGNLFAWEPREGGAWEVSTSYAGHNGSVEDIQWSPTEGTVLASACVDGVRLP